MRSNAVPITRDLMGQVPPAEMAASKNPNKGSIIWIPMFSLFAKRPNVLAPS